MSYKPFKMKGSPMKRNFGIGESENPEAETPISKLEDDSPLQGILGALLGKAIKAGLTTLPGGEEKEKEKEDKDESSDASLKDNPMEQQTVGAKIISNIFKKK